MGRGAAVLPQRGGLCTLSSANSYCELILSEEAQMNGKKAKLYSLSDSSTSKY